MDLRSSNATILLVDDDDQVLDLTAALLHDLVAPCGMSDSGEAVLKILVDGTGANTLLTDLVMPGIYEFQLASAAKTRKLDLSIVCILDTWISQATR